MKFKKAKIKQPTRIGNIVVHLVDTCADQVSLDGTDPWVSRGPGEVATPGWNGIRFELWVLDDDGTTVSVLTGDLASHLSTEEVDTLDTFMASLRRRAEQEIL